MRSVNFDGAPPSNDPLPLALSDPAASMALAAAATSWGPVMDARSVGAPLVVPVDGLALVGVLEAADEEAAGVLTVGLCAAVFADEHPARSTSAPATAVIVVLRPMKEPLVVGCPRWTYPSTMPRDTDPSPARPLLQTRKRADDRPVTRRPLLAIPLALSLALTTAAPSTAAAPHPLPGTTCTVFPADNYWHADISALPVNARSAQWLSHMSPTRRLHPDFGPSYGEQPVPYGIPVTVVSGTHPAVPVTFDYADESDRVNYPLGADTKIEGGNTATGDRHAIVVNKDTCRLYETFATYKKSTGWVAGSGAVWNLRSDRLRPLTWTSADAAGLPILPGLLRYDEVAAGHVDHAIRFTTNVTDRAFVWPARHQAGSVSNHSYPPMGARFRLKKNFNISSYGAQARVVLTAMKQYGLVLADNGSPWFFQGTADTRWQSALLDDLKKVPASAFEAVDTAPLRVSRDSGAAHIVR
jgi:hypothetical protein